MDDEKSHLSPVDDSYVDEVMVEIVGSDVFLDGIKPTRDLEVKCSDSPRRNETSAKVVVVGEIGETDVKGIKDEEISTRVVVDDNNDNNPEEADVVVVGEIGEADVKGIKDETMEGISTRLGLMVDDNKANDPEEADVVVVGEIGETEVDSGVKGIENEAVGDLEVKCSESDEVGEISSRGNEIVEGVVVGESGGAEGIEDDAMEDEGASGKIVTYDQLKDSVDGIAEGETGVAMVVTEESAVKSEAAENDSSNEQNSADADKASGDGEGIDMEHFEQQGDATIEELLVHAETVCPLAYDAENQLAESNPGVDAEIGFGDRVEENGSPQNKELRGSLLKSDVENDDVDVTGNIEVATSYDEISKSRESEEDFSKNHEDHSSETRVADVEMETGPYQNYEQEDFGKSHDSHYETRFVGVGKEAELCQEYHQEEEVNAETEQLSDEGVFSRETNAFDPPTDGTDKRTNFIANIPASTDQNPKPSFKIGECIRRVASQLTGGTSMVVNEISAESSSVIDILSQFQIVAQNPSKPHKFRDEIRTFFSGFRSSVVASKRVRKRKSESEGGTAEEFEFDDAKDSYWTDMIIQNNPEKQMLHDNENEEGKVQLAVPVNGAKPEKTGRKPQSRKKRYFTGNIPNTSDEVDDKAKRMKQETSPAELILNFSERKCIPSEINLNKVFRRYGPLMESETEVDYESGRARVIFKRGSDAQVAHSSSQKFSIFGPVLVNYQIGYSPLISIKVSPVI